MKGTLRKLEGAFHFFELTVLVWFLVQTLQQLLQRRRSYWYPLQNLLALLWHQMRCPLQNKGDRTIQFLVGSCHLLFIKKMDVF